MLTKEKDPTLTAESQQAFVKAWFAEIDDALAREKPYRTTGQKIVDLYEAKTPDDTPFAILYSNTETLAPAVYNARPIPMVKRRFKDADPLGKEISNVSVRLLKFLIDNEDANYDSFDDLMQACVLNGLLTNRGLTRFKYVVHSQASTECIYGEDVRWDKFFHGYARSWKKVPWVGFEWDMTESEVRQNFPEAEGIDFGAIPDHDGGPKTDNSLQGVKLTKVYEIWDKRTGKVFFLSRCCPKMPLKMVEDPLKLSGFFPVPRPLNFMRKVTTLVPTPLYEHYKSQARELNDITVRLKAIIKAIRFRGAYNAAVEGIEKMLKAEDNELIPVENVLSMPDGTGMDKLLWIVPIAELAATAQSLYQQREQVKQVIYEITGISDILRGASVASETATAQNIKNQWGTLRLKKMQKEVQRYSRDALSIILEIACNCFDIQTVKSMTGGQYLDAGAKQQIQQQQAMMAQQAAMMAQQQQMQQPQGQPGQPPVQPPEPPPLPPELQHAMMLPTWEEIYGAMKQALALHYRIDIETNSTIDAEAAQDKQDIADLVNAMSQFMNGLGPLVQGGAMPMEVAKQVLLVISRRFNFGPELEDAINLMKEPAPAQQGPSPADQAKMETIMAQAKVDQAKAQMELQMLQAETQAKQQQAAVEQELAMAELNIKRQELLLQEKALGMKLQAQTMAHQQKMQALMAKATTEEANEKEPPHASI